MLRSMGSTVLLALVAGAMWGCDGERATQPKPSGKVAADGVVVEVTVTQEDGAPVSGVVVEFSRSVAGVAASYDWSATTDANGQARIEIDAGNGYYQARVVQDGSEVMHRASIPLNVGAAVPLNFALAALEPADPRALTRAYVETAIARFERDVVEAIDYYRSPESVEGERALMLLRGDDHTLVLSVLYGNLVGTNTFSAPGTSLGIPISKATPEGHWAPDFVIVNPVTGQKERAMFLFIRRTIESNGVEIELIFGAGHFPTREEYAKDYVQRAIAYYDGEGQAATIDFYNNQASVEGQFYLFLIGADDLYLAHPVQPHLIDTDIKEVRDSSGYELGREIAAATAEGHWVDYLWLNPVTRIEEPKSTWVVRHDGLIFASGYYSPDPNAAPPSWKDADPREYTVAYVRNAIARYERDGLEAFQHYYNSVGSFEGQWYLFATDATDHYILHPLFSHLIGTDIKDVVDSDGYELGRAIAAAPAAGHWVDYLWPHPFTLREAPKVAYAVRHDGLIFASGYYPTAADPRAYTQQYVADAIARYEREGREATTAYYNSQESVDGQWYLLMVSAQDGKLLADGFAPDAVGATMPESLIAGVTEAGKWFDPEPIDNPLAPEIDYVQAWAVLHDGIVFISRYFFGD